MKSKYVIIITLIIFVISFLSIKKLLSNNSNDLYQFILENRPYVSLKPSKIKVDSPRPFETFNIYNFKNVSIKLPNELHKFKESEKSISFVNDDKTLQIFFSVHEGQLIPEELQGSIKNTFSFYKHILYSDNSPEIIYYKAMLIPRTGDEDMAINEIEIGSNKGFLFKGRTANTTRCVYDLFFDKGDVTLNIIYKNNAISQDQINYIISSVSFK